jgi:SAM-dependent methyltransferase
MSCHDPNLEQPVFNQLPECLDDLTILDVGFGRGIWGYLIKTMLTGKPYIVGVEPYAPYCENQRKAFIYDELFNGTIEEYLRDCPNTRFDAIIASEVIEHLDPDTALNVMDELKRHLNPGGVLIITVPDGWTPGGEGFDGNELHKHNSGFEIHDFTKRGYTTSVIPRLHISGRVPAMLGTAWHVFRRGKKPQGIMAVWRPPV